jgi:small subunit ribosomal protein S21
MALTIQGKTRYNEASFRGGGLRARREITPWRPEKGEYPLTQILVKPNESLDQALKRFKKQIQQTGVLREAREHYEYQKPSDKKRKQIAAAKRKAIRNKLTAGPND